MQQHDPLHTRFTHCWALSTWDAALECSACRSLRSCVVSTAAAPTQQQHPTPLLSICVTRALCCHYRSVRATATAFVVPVSNLLLPSASPGCLPVVELPNWLCSRRPVGLARAPQFLISPTSSFSLNFLPFSPPERWVLMSIDALRREYE